MQRLCAARIEAFVLPPSACLLRFASGEASVAKKQSKQAEGASSPLACFACNPASEASRAACLPCFVFLLRKKTKAWRQASRSCSEAQQKQSNSYARQASDEAKTPCLLRSKASNLSVKPKAIKQRNKTNRGYAL
jgi:hypothetical protein